MKRLTLIRHAKSSWGDKNYNDFDRPLKEQGRKDAESIAINVLKEFTAPDAIFVSKAVRTTETVKILLENLSFPKEILHFREDLYTFEWHNLLTFIRNIDNSLESVFLVGHNPALTELINYLSFEKKLLNLPTSGVCSLILEIDSWEEARPDCAQMLLYHYPKEFRSRSNNE